MCFHTYAPIYYRINLCLTLPNSFYISCKQLAYHEIFQKQLDSFYASDEQNPPHFFTFVNLVSTLSKAILPVTSHERHRAPYFFVNWETG